MDEAGYFGTIFTCLLTCSASRLKYRYPNIQRSNNIKSHVYIKHMCLYVDVRTHTNTYVPRGLQINKLIH